jgi:hypothetical protein
MSKQNLDYLEERIDELLATQPVKAAPNFIENTLARLQKEKNNAFTDEKLNQLLNEQHVTTSKSFTSAALNSIQNDRARRNKGTRLVYSLRWWSAVAAVIVLSFVVFYPKYFRPTQPGIDRQVNDTGGVPRVQSLTTNSEALDMNELFVLAETLSEASFLLENSNAESMEVFIQ